MPLSAELAFQKGEQPVQDRYVGDVGDFGKYGLLRALVSGKPSLHLNIVWYLTDEFTVARDPKGDGGDISYLCSKNEHRFLDCDPELYEASRRLIAAGKRSVAAVESSGRLPSGTVTFSERIPTPSPGSGRLVRVRDRKDWFERALKRSTTADVVFVDPDNGLEVPSTPIHRSRSPKHAYFSELDAFIRRNQTLVIYQHRPRFQPQADVIRQGMDQCQKIFDRPAVALGYQKSRVFLISAAPRHAKIVRQRIAAMMAGPWSRHFALVLPTRPRNLSPTSTLPAPPPPVLYSTCIGYAPTTPTEDTHHGLARR